MLKTKNLVGNSCTYENLDKEFSEIEDELEKKLWELYDRANKKKTLKNYSVF